MDTTLGMIGTLGWQCLNVLSTAAILFYLGLVIVGYLTEGPQYQIKFNSAGPFRSMGRVLVGMGVRVLALVLRVANRLLDPLFEASADVGDWFTLQSSPETQVRYRSRFI